MPVIPIFTGITFLLNYIILEFTHKMGIIEYRISGEIQELNFALLFLTTSVTLYLIYKDANPQADTTQRREYEYIFSFSK